MTPAEALEQIRGLASAGRLAFTRHAWQRMDDRDATTADVRHALVSARSCAAQDNGNWRVPGEDLDGDALTVVVAIEDGLVVVTLF